MSVRLSVRPSVLIKILCALFSCSLSVTHYLTLSHSVCVSLSQKRHIHTDTHTPLHTHTHGHTHTGVCANAYTYAHTHPCTRAFIHTHTHERTHTHTHAHTYLYNHTLRCNPSKRAFARGFLSKNVPGDFLIYFSKTNFKKLCACLGSGTTSQGSPQGYATGARTHTHYTHTLRTLFTHYAHTCNDTIRNKIFEQSCG